MLVHSIGSLDHSNYIPRGIVEAAEVLRFDGVYRSVWEHRELLKGKDVTLYVIGSLVGKDNRFDLDNVPKLERFCDWNEIMDLVYQGAKLGWHTWTHPNLTTLSDEDVRKEITPPFPMPYLACPYEQKDERIERIAREVGFTSIV